VTLRRLSRFIEPGHRAPWLALLPLAIAVTVLEVGAALFVFLAVRLIADPSAELELPLLGDARTAFEGVDDSQVLGYTLVFIAAFFVIRGIAVIAQSYVQGRVAQNAGVRISSRLFAGYLAMSYPSYLRRNSAELIRNVNDAVSDVVNHTLVPALRLASEVLIIIGLAVALIITAPSAAFLALAVFTR
jgi:ATP-binding cassette, subfamily B, bacterial PglK